MDAVTFINESILPPIIGGLQREGIRYALGTLTTFIVLWILLSRFIEGRKIRPPTPRTKQVKMELGNSLRTMLVFVLMDIFIFEILGGDVFKKYDDIETYGWVWFAVSIPLLLVIHDAYFYWTHRALHTRKLYKMTHMTHHRSHNPTPFTAYSFAPLEAVVNYLYVPVALMIIPVHGLALYTVLTIMIFKNALGHCGYEVFPRHWARLPVLGWLTTVTHHDMHHEKGSGNFALYFTWWDRWMGTEHPNYLQRLDEQEVRAKALKAARKAAKKRPEMVPAE